MRTLYGLTISLFTEKALFALDHHVIPYQFHEHVPLIGELFLRLKSKGRATGTKATVPLLVDGDESLTSSIAIAQYADRIGSGAKLFSAEHDEAIAHFAALSDQIIEMGRTRLVHGMRGNHEAQLENTPAWVPGPLRGAFAPSVALATSFIASKHKVTSDSGEVIARARPALEEVRAALAKGPYLVGDSFSFADIAIASALGVVKPHANMPVGPATRVILTQETLVDELADLLSWRDEVYRQHRKAPVSPS